MSHHSEEKYSEKDNHVGGVTQTVTEVRPDNERVVRELKPRQVSMIAIAGTIGTGLFLGSGRAIVNGGPVGATIGYLVMGLLVGAMMYCLGEMVCHDPAAGGFVVFASRYVDPALGFASGWNFWWQCSITFAVEVVAAAILIEYWDPSDGRAGIYIAILLVATIFINVVGVKYFGETEFWFAALKIVTIIGLLILALVISLGGAPDKDRRGFRHWRDTPFNSTYLDIQNPALARFLGFWAVLTQAAFSYGGIETLSAIAMEAVNPKVTMRSAIRAVFYRIVGLYVLAILMIGLCVPPNDDKLLGAIKEGSGTAAQSPFVVMVERAGITTLPHIINAVVLTSAFSSGNEFLYAASRALYSMAIDGNAPAIFKRTTKGGVPIYAVGFSSLFGLLSFLNLSSGSATVFNWLGNITTLASMFSWMAILWTYIRFYKATKIQNFDRSTLPMKSSWTYPMAYVCLIFFIVVAFFNGFASFIGGFVIEDFMAAYVTVLLFAVLYFGNKFWAKTKIVSLEAMDLSSTYDKEEAAGLYANDHHRA